MGRSVVLAGAARCPCCQLQPRWCICDAIPPVDTAVGVHVFIHRHEHGKPSSTGRLVARVVNGANASIYQRQSRFFPAAAFPTESLAADRELWILHPTGAPLPAATTETTAATRRRPQILLLDATWRQAGEMLRSVEGLGRCVRLPESTAEPSRFWLRHQAEPTHVSTAEAVMGVFRGIGETAAAERLRLHFELHVYAMLLARGRRELAARYLGGSPLSDALPGFLADFHARRAD